MVSKRQKLAKKKIQRRTPRFIPKAKSSFNKHPLRIPGLKPGDSCYICKDVNHIAKNCPEKAEWERNKICLFCRQRGHSMENCHSKGDDVIEQLLCYNCGENGHSLSKCPRPLQGGGTKFALCFICKERGHLSKDCPKNTHGIYPKGGCCKICSGINHLARDCPNKGTRGSFYDNGRESFVQQEQPRGKVTKLFSGDDLEEDFMIEDADKGNNDSKKTKNVLASDANHTDHVKKKQGAKVVNFGNAASGMAVDDECNHKFMELKAKRIYRFITFKIEDQQVVVDKIVTPNLRRRNLRMLETNKILEQPIGLYI
ncbi:hypothetical protein RND81_08G051500 [Saponaria officinalis]|uniref:CCHC-type domain-containing protein n=1 Tax=Saponaria officinalis TaxID=3572 RepID=A0AAW1J4L9_SAPOF